MLADEFKEIRNLADELYDDLGYSLAQDKEFIAHLQGYLEEVSSLMTEALEVLSEQ